jgi:hypothetical protein
MLTTNNLQFTNQTLRNYFLYLAHVLECLYGVQENSTCTNRCLRIIYVLLGSIKGWRNDVYTFNYGCTNYYDDDYATNYQADYNYYY